MAKAFQMYMIFCVAAFIMCVYMIQNKTMDIHSNLKKNFGTMMITFQQNAKYSNSKYFLIDDFDTDNDILQLKGHFSGSKLFEILSINKKELSRIIRQEVISEDKLPTSALTNRIPLRNSSLFLVGRKVRDVNCRLLIKGDEHAIKKAVNMSANFPKEAITPREYIQMTRNCSKFTSERGYITDPLSEIEKNFPISYSILMYTAVEQSEILLRTIYRPQNSYCIHVDSKSSADIFEAMSNIAKCFENVFIASKRYDIKWGTMTVLEPELLCMEELWNKSRTWKYFINLTGQEFPLRTNYELVQILKAYNGANDIEGVVARANKERWKNAGTAPHGIVPVKGAVHIAASRGYVDFLLHDKRARDLLDWTRRTEVPDETFFSTLNHNPILGVPGSYKGYAETEMTDDIKPYVARFKNWGDGHYNWTCNGKWVRNICVFGIGDLPLLASRRELFANKFFLDYHRLTLECMEELLFNNTRDEYLGKLPFDVRWYSKLGFVSNKVD